MNACIVNGCFIHRQERQSENFMDLSNCSKVVRQTDGRTDRKTDRHELRSTLGQTDRLTDRQTDTHTDREPDRQTNIKYSLELLGLDMMQPHHKIYQEPLKNPWETFGHAFGYQLAMYKNSLRNQVPTL